MYGVKQMKKSINFNLFLMDGEVTGRIKCTLANWTGLAYRIPRQHLANCKDRSDLKNSGVYFLFGQDSEEEEEVYIGQAGNRRNGQGVLFRVIEHTREENNDFTDVIILTTQNNSFGPTEISYLEHKFTNMARETGRFKVRNNNDPHIGNVTEEKESELLDFLEYSKLVLGVLGYKIFVPLLEKPSPVVESESKELELYLKKTKRNKEIIEAKCISTNEGFVVLEGSMIDEYDQSSIPLAIKEKREKARKKGRIVNGKITKDYLFNSPSAAAAFIRGASSNVRTAWKTREGITLKELEEREIKKVLK